MYIFILFASINPISTQFIKPSFQ